MNIVEFRGLYLFGMPSSSHSGNDGSVQLNVPILFARKWLVVEKRYRKRVSEGSDSTYKVLPSDAELASSFFRHLFSEDGAVECCCELADVGLTGKVVFFIKRKELYLVGVVTSDTCGFDCSILVVLDELFRMIPSATQSTVEAVQEFGSLLSFAMPFGKPVEMNVSVIRSVIKDPFPQQQLREHKRSGWKPHTFKGKQRLELMVREEILCCEDDRDGCNSTCIIQGTIVCLCALEGDPDVTLVLKPVVAPFAHLLIHDCVSFPEGLTEPRLFFSPPLEVFNLCRYQLQPKKSPISASYAMQEESENLVRISLNIKIDRSEIAAGIQQCHVQIPFPNRGKIVSTQLVPSGYTSIGFDNDPSSVMWIIGNRLSVSKTAELSLHGTVSFKQLDTAPMKNPYAESFARLTLRSESSLSGLKIDENDVVVYPSSKKTFDVEYQSADRDFIIWNRLSELRNSIPVDALLPMPTQ